MSLLMRVYIKEQNQLYVVSDIKKELVYLSKCVLTPGRERSQTLKHVVTLPSNRFECYRSSEITFERMTHDTIGWLATEP